MRHLCEYNQSFIITYWNGSFVKILHIIYPRASPGYRNKNLSDLLLGEMYKSATNSQSDEVRMVSPMKNHICTHSSLESDRITICVPIDIFTSINQHTFHNLTCFLAAGRQRCDLYLSHLQSFGFNNNMYCPRYLKRFRSTQNSKKNKNKQTNNSVHLLNNMKGVSFGTLDQNIDPMLHCIK